jgi:hypothetical protein
MEGSRQGRATHSSRSNRRTQHGAFALACICGRRCIVAVSRQVQRHRI